MNYDEMTDHEINMIVTSIIHNCRNWEISASNMSFYNCGIDGNDFNEIEVVDYCNNLSDAWPIIVENKIRIQSQSQGSNSDLWCAFWHNEIKFSYVSLNPLRAAMICFLKMKEEHGTPTEIEP